MKGLTAEDVLKLLESSDFEISDEDDDEDLFVPENIGASSSDSDADEIPVQTASESSSSNNQPKAETPSSSQVRKKKSLPGKKYLWKKKLFQCKHHPGPLDLYKMQFPDTLRTPLQYFTTYFTDEFFKIAEEHTNQYTVWKHGKSIKTDAKELKKFIAVNLIMGCIKFPRLRLYWSTEYGYTPISTIMSRDRFLALRNAFHVVDASTAPDNNNKLWKVQPVIDAVRNVCLSLPRDHVTYSIDEQMIPFTGRCPLRQFVKNKPRPVGLKNFVLTTSAGLVLDFKIYQGDSTPLQTKEFGLGPSVILRLAQTLPQESFIYFDRYFTSLPLLGKLTEMKLYGSGTIMANRIKGLPLTDARKMVRGQSMEHVAENCDLVVVEWKDSNKVIMASNCCGSTPTEPVQRWSKIENKHIEVDCPSVVRKYNQNMGGVDVCDQQMECYRAWF